MQAVNPPRYGLDPYHEWVEREGIRGRTRASRSTSSRSRPADWPRYGVKGAARALRRQRRLLQHVRRSRSRPAARPRRSSISTKRSTTSSKAAAARSSSSPTAASAASSGARAASSRSRSTPSTGTSTPAARSAPCSRSTTTLPLIMKIFHNEEFIFNTPFAFGDRIGNDEYYAGEGDLTMIRPGNNIWETNFVPDLANDRAHARGTIAVRAHRTSSFVLADGIMHAHISEIAPATYKKAHRHLAGHARPDPHRRRLLAALERGRDRLHARRLEARRRLPALREAVPPALRDQQQRLALCRDRPRRDLRYPLTEAQRRMSLSDAGRRSRRSRAASRRAATRSSTRIRIRASTRSGSRRCASAASRRS